MAKTSLKNELKALGGDIADALKAMKESREFKKLHQDLVAGVKAVSASVSKAIKAANKSPQTARLKTRIKKVVHLGKKEGMIQAKKAEVLAAQKIKEVREAIRQMGDKSDPK